MPKKGSSEPSRGGKERSGVAEAKKLAPSAKKSNDEIDEIFASKKAAKSDKGKPDKLGDALSIKPKKMKKKNDKKDRGGDNLNGMDSKQASRSRKRTGDGLAIYTEDELGINKAEAGRTPLCPFDCSCCF